MKGTCFNRISKKSTRAGFTLVEVLVTITLLVTMHVILGGRLINVSIVEETTTEEGLQFITLKNIVSIMCPLEGGWISQINTADPGAIVSRDGERYDLILGETGTSAGTATDHGLTIDSDPEVESGSGRLNVQARLTYTRSETEIGHCLAVLEVEVPRDEFFESFPDGRLESLAGAHLEVNLISNLILTREQALELLPADLANFLNTFIQWGSGSGFSVPPIYSRATIQFNASLQGMPEDDGIVVGSGADKTAASTDAGFAGCGFIKSSSSAPSGALWILILTIGLLGAALRFKQSGRA